MYFTVFPYLKTIGHLSIPVFLRSILKLYQHINIISCLLFYFAVCIRSHQLNQPVLCWQDSHWFYLKNIQPTSLCFNWSNDLTFKIDLNEMLYSVRIASVFRTENIVLWRRPEPVHHTAKQYYKWWRYFISPNNILSILSYPPSDTLSKLLPPGEELIWN